MSDYFHLKSARGPLTFGSVLMDISGIGFTRIRRKPGTPAPRCGAMGPSVWALGFGSPKSCRGVKNKNKNEAQIQAKCNTSPHETYWDTMEAGMGYTFLAPDQPLIDLMSQTRMVWEFVLRSSQTIARLDMAVALKSRYPKWFAPSGNVDQHLRKTPAVSF